MAALWGISVFCFSTNANLYTSETHLILYDFSPIPHNLASNNKASNLHSWNFCLKEIGHKSYSEELSLRKNKIG